MILEQLVAQGNQKRQSVIMESIVQENKLNRKHKENLLSPFLLPLCETAKKNSRAKISFDLVLLLVKELLILKTREVTS